MLGPAPLLLESLDVAVAPLPFLSWAYNRMQ